ncbi:MAG: sulfatase-like hydrolase/transferase [Planctomycetaceae bacterium]|nr:sulfatase-like hydrolase/transferase [Planctomycetaceae bacterium]
MTMHARWHSVRATLLMAAAVAGLNPSSDAAERPNILLLVTDDQRSDSLSCAGSAFFRTPYLDALAGRGTRFLQASCSNPLCYPSRAEIVTGCTGFRSGVRIESRFREGLPYLPNTFREAGYRTAYVGKWHHNAQPNELGYDEAIGFYASGRQPPDQDYRDFRGVEATGYRGWQFRDATGKPLPALGIGLTPDISSRFADAAIEFLDRPRSQPFLLHVNFTAPHDPLLIPPGTDPLSRVEQVVLPTNSLPEHPFDHGNAHGRDEMLFPFPRTPDALKPAWAVYAALVEDIDRQIGRILARLAETGELENTLIVFTSDHGLALGSHGLTGKQNMYEHTLNVPLIVAGPGVVSGQVTDAQCVLRDLFPTLCDLANVPAPHCDGESFADVLRGQSDTARPYIIGYYGDVQRAIRRDSWKLIWYPQIDRVQLFDLKADPHELNDLSESAEFQKQRSDLEETLKTWLREQGDPVVVKS